MIEIIFGISLLEFIGTIVILIDLGPEAAHKIKRWGSKEHWLR